MAHEIHGEMFVGAQSAWHNLGIVDPDLQRASDAIVAGSMDYTIHKVPLSAVMPGGVVIPFDSHGLVRGPTVHDNSYASLGTCSADYAFLQNTELAHLVDVLQDKTGWGFSTAGVLGNGDRVFFCLEMEPYQVAGDEVQRYFGLLETRNGKASSRVFNSRVRVVCRNTCDLALQQATGKASIKHYSSYRDELEWVMQIIADVSRSGASIDAALSQLAEIQIDDEVFVNMLDAVSPEPSMPNIMRMLNPAGKMKEKADRAEYVYNLKLEASKRTREAIIGNYNAANDIPEAARGTAWHAFQAVTHYTTHTHGSLGSRGRKATPANRAEFDLFGDGAMMRNAAYAALTENI